MRSALVKINATAWIDSILKRHGVDFDEVLVARRQTARATRARDEILHTVRSETGFNLLELSRIFGMDRHALKTAIERHAKLTSEAA